MNGEVALALLRQRAVSPMRVLILALVFGPATMITVFTGSLAPMHAAGCWFAMVLAAGAIGQEVSSGVLQLTFARPVTRAAYVTGRWLAAAGGGFALALVQLGLVAAILAARGMAPPPVELLALLLEDALLAMAGAAVLVAFSAGVNGLADVGVWFVLVMTGELVGGFARLRGWTPLAVACDELGRTLRPEVHLDGIAGLGSPAWTELATVASTITLGLAVAIVLVNRRELSYAAD